MNFFSNLNLTSQYSLLKSQMEKDFKISSAQQYEDTMITIFEWQEQEEPLNEQQKAEMKIMLAAAQKYEDEEL